MPGAARCQTAGGGESPYRVLRSVSGSKGEIRDGRYVVLDPRTTFRVPEDKTIVVYFEWLGPMGKHHLSGTWHGPMNTSTTTEFEYVARDTRFSAYWELGVPDSMPHGSWSLEVHIDGAPAGSHQLTIEGMDAPVPVAVAVKTPLTRQEAFARTLSSAVRVEALDAAGTRLATGPGIPLDATTVATSFALIEGAARVRVLADGGAPKDAGETVGWNRRQDWVLLRVPSLPVSPAVVRAADPVQPGDECFSVTAGPEGTLAVAGGEIVGLNTFDQAGPRISVSLFTASGSPGAPVLNEYGEVVGMLTAGLLPGAGPFNRLTMALDGSAPHALAIPTAELIKGIGTAVAFSTLAERGLFVPPVTHGRQVVSGGFASGIRRSGPSTQPIDQRVEFLPTDPAVAVFVNWNPAEKFKGVTLMRVYDLDNRQLFETPPTKVNMKPGDLMMSAWHLKTPPPGVYRTDVLLGTDIAWRGFFRVK